MNAGSPPQGPPADPEPRARIRVLPPELADQIAAGEVVERPASVVKELVENSIDAGARKVEVEVEAGGRRLIRVADDGGGMTADEARLALRRHATSKLAQADDLWGLLTFGFRGEALPSIAAVSRLSLSTKRAGRLAGFRLVVEGGRELEGREVGMPDGTQIEVRDLFYNVPARLKFLKAEATEAGNVSETLLRLSLSHPEVHLKLRLNDRATLDLPPQRDLGERVRAALARRGAGVLHEALGEEGGVRVHAFLAGPEEATTTPRNTFLFVGRRFVRDRSLLSALCLGYGELLDKGRYPLAALFLEVPGPEVDINVHPQKLEVRFARAQEVYAAVRHVVAAAVARAPWLAVPARAHTLPLDPADDERLAAGGSSAGSSSWRGPGGAEGVSRGGAGSRAEGGALGRGAPFGDEELWTPTAAGAAALGAREAGPSRGGVGLGARDAETTAAEALFGRPAAPRGHEGAERPTAESATPADLDGYFSRLDYFGQLDRTYLVCQGEGELVLVDQHAAHERVAYHRLRTAHKARAIARQRLLFPIPIELDEEAVAACAGEGRTTLEALGFEVAPSGPRALLLHTVPEVSKAVDPKPLLRDVVSQLVEGGQPRSTEAALEHVLATMACHSVVRAGDLLGREQAVSLLASLDAVDVRSHCPHGRPLVVRISVDELERRFGRT